MRARRRRLRGLHLAQELHRPRPRARTPSRCARPTPPATPTRRPRASRGRSTRRAPNTTITAQPSDPTNATGADFTFTSSEGGVDASSAARRRRAGRPAPRPKSYTGLERRLPHLRGARDRRRRQHRPDAGDASRGRSTRPRRTRTITGAAERPDATPPTPSFTFSSSEGGSTFECPLDGGALVVLRQPEELHRPEPTARTPSRCARPTPPATPTRRPRSFTWTIDTAAPTRRSPRSRATRRTRPARRSPSPRPRAARRSSASSTAAPAPPARSPQDLHRARRRLAHLRGARDRRRRQHRPDARVLHVDDRHRRAGDDDHRAAQRPEQLRGRRLHLQLAARAARPSSARSTAAPSRPAPRPKSYTGLRRRRAHLRGARDRRRRQHRPDARDATPGRSTRPRRTRRSPRSPATRATPPTPTSPSAPSEAGSTFECQLDGGGWSACASPKSYTGLTDGSHTFEVRATDAAGNTDADARRATPGRSTRPRRTRRSPRSPSDPSNSSGPDFTFSATEAGSTLRVLSSTAARSRLHLAEELHRPEPTARTPSRCARPTRPATPTRPPRATPGRSTPPRRARPRASR